MRQPIILLISENRPKAALIYGCLREAGYQVFEANRGANVPDLLKQVQPQLALLDWDLPDLSALAVIRTIRAQRGFTRMPVILIGSEISCENKVLSLEAGVDFCLDGTVNPKEIVARVRALFRRMDSARQA